MSSPFRGALRALLVAVCLLPTLGGTALAAPDLDLEKTSATELSALMAQGKLTSYELTRAYIDRIAATNRRGPSINAVRSLNPKALDEAKASDAARAAAGPRGPLEGLPVLLKDNIDVVGVPTTAGSISLEHSVPDKDSFLVKKLREAGAIILGKTTLTEFAAGISDNQQSGNGSLQGQALNPNDRAYDVCGSSAGSGAAASAGLGALTFGSDTEGSILCPSSNNGVVGLRPTTGLISRTGVVPLGATQDTTGPMTQTVADTALTLDAVVGVDPEDSGSAETASVEGTKYTDALKTDALQGARIGVWSDRLSGANYAAMRDALVAQGATIVTLASSARSFTRGSNLAQNEMRRDMNAYLGQLPADAPLKSFDQLYSWLHAHAEEGLKYGSSRIDPSAKYRLENPAELADYEFRRARDVGAARTYVNTLLDQGAGPEDDLDAVLNLSSDMITPSAYGGFPELSVPAGVTAADRRPVNINLIGRRYSEKKLVGYAYALEQATKLRTSPSELNPAEWRCVPGPRYDPHSCAPFDPFGGTLSSTLLMPLLDLEDLSVDELHRRFDNGTLTSATLVDAYLHRIDVVNRQGPGLNVIRAINPEAKADALAADAKRAAGTATGPLEGLPVIVSDTIDVKGMPTTGGSLALENLVAPADAGVVTKLKAAGAIILAKANVSELQGMVSSGTPAGYGSLSGQAMNPYDMRATAIGSSGGAVGAAAAGLAAVTIGMETDGSARGTLLTGALAAGVVAIRPTFGVVSRSGTMPVARSQDTVGAVGRTVSDAASALTAIAGPDPDDATTGTTARPDYRALLDKNSLSGKRIGYVANASDQRYTEAMAVFTSLGATLVALTAPSNPTQAQVVDRQFKRDFNAYLGGFANPPVASLTELVAFNAAHPNDTLKFGQQRLVDAEAVDLTGAAGTQLDGDIAAGRTAAQTAIDTRLANAGAPVDAIMSTVAQTAAIGARAGYPQVTVPDGYTVTTRRPSSFSLTGTAGDDAKLLSFAYAYERASLLRETPSQVNPQTWNCVAPIVYTPRTCGPGEFTVDEAPEVEATPTPIASVAPTPTPVVTPAPKPVATVKTRSLRLSVRRAGKLVTGDLTASSLPASVRSLRLRVYAGDKRVISRTARVFGGKVKIRLSASVPGRSIVVTVTPLGARGGAQSTSVTSRLTVGKPLKPGKRGRVLSTPLR